MHTFEFLFSSEAPGSICEFVESLPRGFGDKIVPKGTCNESVVINNCSLFKIKLVFWLAYKTRLNRCSSN